MAGVAILKEVCARTRHDDDVKDMRCAHAAPNGTTRTD